MPEVAPAPPPVLLEALRREVAGMADRAAGRMVADLRSYRHLDVEEVAPIVAGNLRAALDAIAGTGEEGSPDAQDSLPRDAGRVRAAQGISVDDMLHAWRLGVEELRAGARRHATKEGLPDSVLLGFTDRALAWADRGMLASAAAHRDAELDAARHEQHVRATVVRGILFGTIAPGEAKLHALAYGLDLGAAYAPFRARVAGMTSTRTLELRLGVAEGSGRRHGLAAFVDGDLVGFSSRLPLALDDLPGQVVGAGPAAALDAQGPPFVLATRALHAALALGRTGLLSFAGLGLRPAVMEDDDVGRPLDAAIVDAVLAHGAAGRTILDTVVRYLANERRLDVTAGELHAHVNTIRHRLQRFELLTGRRLRDTESLVEVWWALTRWSDAPVDGAQP